MTTRLNEQYIELMEKLATIMLKQGEAFRAKAYQKAQETIMSFSRDIVSPNDLKGQPGIGPTILEKLTEYTETGTLGILEREKANPVNILADVYGIGPKKAKELVEHGITSIAQLRENQDLLNDIQKIGLHYYEDILKRIPRSEIEEYKTHFQQALPRADVKMEIVGSYRRGAESSGDIDVIITSDQPQVFVKFVDALLAKKIIAHVLSRGPTKCLVIAKIPTSATSRRVDFLFTSPEEFPFAILYFTGSKIFNTVMRQVALEKGFTMNEHGIHRMDGKVKGEKVDRVFNTEKDIFSFLRLVYKAPADRIDGRSVIRIPKKIMILDDDVDTCKEAAMQMAANFKQIGVSFLHQLNENQLTQLLREANRAYFNHDPFLLDSQYDIIKEFVEAKYPANQAVHQVGAPVEKNKVVLPYPMGSMDKIKPDTCALANWCAKYAGPYVLSCKLDGVSGLYTTEGDSPKLYTRGDGRVGQDISHLIPHLRLPRTKGIAVRGEFIIPRALFEAKYKDSFANPRNLVAGIVNFKGINSAIKDVHFVAYEVMHPVMKPSEQLALLSTFDVEVVMSRAISGSPLLTNDLLSKMLLDWRYNCAYEIDGIIVANDKVYQRKASGNPEHAFAFKMVLTDQIAEAKVVDVLWSPSKDGYLKPRVQIEPIQLGGVCITFATGFNGAFIQNNMIGVGAVVELIRSGDVIPYIRRVIVPAESAKMPDVDFKWNDTNIDVLMVDADADDTVREKNITGFFKGIGVEGLSSGNVKRIMNAGFDTIAKILRMSVADFLQVDGFKEKMAAKLFEGIQERIGEISLLVIMSSCNVFGRGFSEKKIELIMEACPDILVAKESPAKKVARLTAIKGMASKSAEAFVERIPEFLRFLQETGLVGKTSSSKAATNTSHPLFGKTVVMTGFRDAAFQMALKEVGAKLGTSVSSKTFAVVVKNKDEDTGKAAEARSLQIPIMLVEDFCAKYSL